MLKLSIQSNDNNKDDDDERDEFLAIQSKSERT